MHRRRTWFRLALLLLLAGGAYFVATRWISRTHRGTEPIPIDAIAASVTYERAFPSLEFDRPILVTYPPDGTNRVAVVLQAGSVHVFPNDDGVVESSELIDISEQVSSKASSNEEGLLGLAFHPTFRDNRQFFLYYTNQDHFNILSRFRMSADEPDRADPASEEELFRTPQSPSQHHNGGSILFGPDGFLYVAIGDGGPPGDPHDRGQDLQSVLGKILRIDVDHHDPGLKYAIPKDNPMAGRADARGEIWAYGLRNVWRMAFDRQTGRLWAGDVGDDTWEEIDIIERGGNYGWSIKEGFAEFVNQPPPARPRKQPASPLTDPAYVYHHSVGQCVVGGCVYRGQRIPQLFGAYLFADYVTGQDYALRYDDKPHRATSVQRVEPRGMPVYSFGEDASGEVYFTTSSGVIHRLVPAKNIQQ